MNSSPPLGLAAPSDSPPAAAAGVPARRASVSSGCAAYRLPRRVGARRAARRAVGERRARPRARLYLHVVAARRRRPRDVRAHAARRRRDVSRPRRDLSRGEPDAARDVRSRRHRVGSRRSAAVAVAGELADRPFSAAPRFRGASPKWQPGQEEYAFVRVEGDGVHEIPVGPVHAGIIEPGHFRFQVVGEKVLRLEERLGFVHKGIEKRFEAMPPPTATGSPAASPATAPSRTPGRMRRRSKRSPDARCRRARAVAARARARTRAHRQSPGRPRLSRQRRRLRVRPRAVLAAQGGRAAHESRAVRPSARDGLRRAGRRGARPSRPTRAAIARRMRHAGARGARAARHLRRA